MAAVLAIQAYRPRRCRKALMTSAPDYYKGRATCAAEHTPTVYRTIRAILRLSLRASQQTVVSVCGPLPHIRVVLRLRTAAERAFTMRACRAPWSATDSCR